MKVLERFTRNSVPYITGKLASEFLTDEEFGALEEKLSEKDFIPYRDDFGGGIFDIEAAKLIESCNGDYKQLASMLNFSRRDYKKARLMLNKALEARVYE